MKKMAQKFISILGVVVFFTFICFLPALHPLTPYTSISSNVRSLQLRAESLSDSMDSFRVWYETEVIPVADDLLATGKVKDTTLVPLVAIELVRNADKHNINKFLLSALVKVENPWLVPDTVSYAGAVGIMQIMPLWQSSFTDCGTNHEDIRTNICKGTEILALYLERSYKSALDNALLRYNGCVKTPGCEIYATKVGKNIKPQEVYTNKN